MTTINQHVSINSSISIIEDNINKKYQLLLLSSPPSSFPYAYCFFVQNSVNNIEIKKLTLKTRKIKLLAYYYIIHIINVQYMINKNLSKLDFINLNFNTLGKIIGQNVVKYIIDDLLEMGIIECDNTAIRGSKSKGYRITEKYRDDKIKQIQCTDKFILKNIAKHKEQFKKDMLEKNKEYGYDYMHLINYHCDLKIKSQEAYRYAKEKCETPDQLIEWENSINDFKNKNWHISVSDKNQRLFTNLTNLPKSLRQFLRYKNNELGYIDMNNAQPLIFCKLLEKSLNFKNHACIYEYERYKKLVEAGQFYNFMAGKLGVEINNDEIIKSEFKKKIFARLFFSKNNPWFSDEECAFYDEFPNIFDSIRKYKDRDHTYLSLKLQELESKIFIKSIVNRIRIEEPNMFIATIHDSIVCEVENMDYVHQMMKEVIDIDFKLNPTFDIKLFN